MLISVIVPIYKVEPYLDKCITSIVQQTYSNLEIILVDDGSPDNCPAMCDRWAEKDNRIRVVHKENGGISSARNAGLRAAQGQFISFIDSDDYIDPKMLEMMMAEMDDEKVGFVQCGWRELFPGGVVDHTTARVRMNALQALDQKLQEKGNIANFLWNKLFRRSILENIEFCEDLHYGEDIPYVIQALLQAEDIVLTPFVGYYYIRRDDSLSTLTYQAYKIQALHTAYAIADTVVEAYPQLREQAQFRIAYIAYYQMQNIIRAPHWRKKFPQEYALCIQTLRKSDPAAVKKYFSTKEYMLFRLCSIAPAMYAVIYATWQKVKAK